MEEIYLREDLLQIYKDPSHKGKLENPTEDIHEINPMCGDDLALQISIENGHIKDAKFDGHLCAVSTISADLLTDEIIGKSLKEAKKLTKDQLLEMIGVELTTSRIKCATLALDALHKIGEQNEQ